MDNKAKPKLAESFFLKKLLWWGFMVPLSGFQLFYLVFHYRVNQETAEPLFTAKKGYRKQQGD